MNDVQRIVRETIEEMKRDIAERHKQYGDDWVEAYIEKAQRELKKLEARKQHSK